MNIPNYENTAISDRSGFLTDIWSLILQQLISELQKNVGLEGFVVSTVSSDPNSVTPPTAGGQRAKIQATFGQQNGVVPGTVIYDPYPANLATNGQLFVLLEDGVFHAITNT